MQTDLRLLAALETWRRENAIAKFGVAKYDLYGPSLFFPAPMLQRVINGIYTGKIIDIDSLCEETRWRRDWAEEHGPSLFAVIVQ